MIKFRVKKEPPMLDDQEIINKVFKHEFLYDTKNPDYRNLPQRDSVWMNIANALNIRDKNIVQKRWKVLREKFSVSYRKYQNEGTHPSWNLYEACSFLAPYINLKPDFKKDQSSEEVSATEKIVPPSPFDENILMKLVKQRPILYDKQHEDFRAGPLRKKAWQEIANQSGWDIGTVTKRWRVMRDRFVRELRRTKNIDSSDGKIQCSAFFNDMLFLVNHVKSKSYIAEAINIDDVSWENPESVEEGELKLETEQLESCIVSLNTETAQAVTEDTTETSCQALSYAIDENDEYVECYAADECNESEESYHDNSNDYFEEEALEVDETDEGQLEIIQPDDVTAMEQIPEEQWFSKSPPSFSLETKVSRKRRISFDPQDEPPAKKEFTKADSPAPSTSDTPDDEDAVFGRTIGLMLRKIPQHLKTSVKLKLFQSLAEFEIEHKLNEPK